MAYTLIHEFKGETVLSICQYLERTFVCTDMKVYEVADNKLVPVEICFDTPAGPGASSTAFDDQFTSLPDK